tara:strand:+ start:567 stop:1256 length:690 start_codon:yes stop_codon:yes gene_type:complete
VPNAALEYLDDLPLQLDALIAMMECGSDPTLLLKSISKRFVNLAKDKLNKVAWCAVAQTLNQVVVLWNNGEKEEALRIIRDVRERSDKYTNLEEVTDVEKVFAENAGSRVELVLTTSLKSVPIMMRSIESGDLAAINSAIHDADSFANVLLASGGSLLKELLFFGKLGRDLKEVKSMILQKNKAQAISLLTLINQALLSYSPLLAGQPSPQPAWLTAAIKANTRAIQPF